MRGLRCPTGARGVQGPPGPSGVTGIAAERWTITFPAESYVETFTRTDDGPIDSHEGRDDWRLELTRLGPPA